MKSKKCTKCKELLLETNEYFAKTNKTKSGLRSICKQCEKLYREKTKEQRSEYDKYYYKRNKERIQEQVKKYSKENEEEIKRRRKLYREINKELIMKSNRKYYEANKDKIMEYHRRYGRENKDIINAQGQRRKSREKGVLSTLTVEQWKQIKKDFDYRCCYCGKETKLEQEHFIPLIKGGEYTHNNILPSCKRCNCSKQDKDFFDWYQTQEFYSPLRKKKILSFLNYKDNEQQLTLL